MATLYDTGLAGPQLPSLTQGWMNSILQDNQGANYDQIINSPTYQTMEQRQAQEQMLGMAARKAGQPVTGTATIPGTKSTKSNLLSNIGGGGFGLGSVGSAAIGIADSALSAFGVKGATMDDGVNGVLNGVADAVSSFGPWGAIAGTALKGLGLVNKYAGKNLKQQGTLGINTGAYTTQINPQAGGKTTLFTRGKAKGIDALTARQDATNLKAAYATYGSDQSKIAANATTSLVQDKNLHALSGGYRTNLIAAKQGTKLIPRRQLGGPLKQCSEMSIAYAQNVGDTPSDKLNEVSMLNDYKQFLNTKAQDQKRWGGQWNGWTQPKSSNYRSPEYTQRVVKGQSLVPFNAGNVGTNNGLVPAQTQFQLIEKQGSRPMLSSGHIPAPDLESLTRSVTTQYDPYPAFSYVNRKISVGQPKTIRGDMFGNVRALKTSMPSNVHSCGMGTNCDKARAEKAKEMDPKGRARAQAAQSYKPGGKLKQIAENVAQARNVIPEGALHARKNNYEGLLGEKVTNKGIPVITLEDGGVTQHAEIERAEIIFTKPVSEQLETLANQYKDASEKEKAALELECGKLLVKEILYNTDDNAGLIV